MAYNHIIDPMGDVVLTLSNANKPIGVLTALQKEVGEPAYTSSTFAAVNYVGSKITFLLSSRHLILASPMLKAALTGPWFEAKTKDADGLHRIDAQDWDVEGMKIVMNIIHGLWPKVPRVVDLVQLCKISIIADYYQVQPALDLIAPIWIAHLKNQSADLPPSYGPNLAAWICIVWVFKDAALFKEATRNAIQTYSSRVDVDGLPIPSKVFDQIKQQRESIISAMTKELMDQEKAYLSGKAGCNPTCTAVSLGTLTKAIHDFRLRGESSSSTNIPISGAEPSLPGMIANLGGITSPVWYEAQPACTKTHSSYSGPHCQPPSPHKCPKALASFTTEMVVKYWGKVQQGLELNF